MSNGGHQTVAFRACLVGFALLLSVRGIAAQLPAHSHKMLLPPGWACDDGYVQRGSQCVSLFVATDGEVRSYLVAVSIAAYSGSCPCPFNLTRAGRRCGGNSAYSRLGGRQPLCFEQDVTLELVRETRERHRPKLDR